MQNPPNILDAIKNITLLQDEALAKIDSNVQHITESGSHLEKFIQSVFSKNPDSFLSYKSKFPDFAIKGGDAIEVKKIEKINVKAIQLNSSHPKATVIIKGYPLNETREERDVIYAIGYIKKKKLYSLWFVYGSIYAAAERVYIEQKKKCNR